MDSCHFNIGFFVIKKVNILGITNFAWFPIVQKILLLEVVLIIVPEIAESKILQSVFIIMHYVNGKLKIYRNGSVVVI